MTTNVYEYQCDKHPSPVVVLITAPKELGRPAGRGAAAGEQTFHCPYCVRGMTFHEKPEMAAALRTMPEVAAAIKALTPEARTALRLLRMELGATQKNGYVKAIVECMRSMNERAGTSFRDAAALILREQPGEVDECMDRIGLHPSSEAPLAAIQEAWLKKNARRL